MSKSNNKNKMKCDEVRQHLFAYLTHDIGSGRAQLIKHHLKECSECQKELAQIKEAMSMLKINAELNKDVPDKLSKKHRDLIVRSFMHPVLDFIYRHHVIISLIVAIITLIASMVILWHLKIYFDDAPEPGIEVFIGDK